MHSKSDSEVTSLPGSSPPRSPRLLLRPPASTAPPAYYVQSPSRDSHDGGDSKLSFQSTPLLSPLGSPLHPGGGFARDRSSDARSSASSQATTVPRKHTHHHSRRVQPQPAHNSASNKSKSNEASHHEKKLPSTIFEEDEEFGASKSITPSQIYTFLFVILSCAVFLGLFILFFWIICKPGRPALSVKNIVFHNLYMGQGTDASGVPSMLLSVNATVQIDFENPSKYFGAHLNPLLVELDYSELVIATEQMDGLVQGKNTRKVISIPVGAVKVPLYGASSTVPSTQKPSIPLTMGTSICSHYYIVGQMVKSKFCSYISCNLDINSNTMALLTPIKSACTYYTSL